MLSVNQKAWKLVKHLSEVPEAYNVSVRTESEATIIDAGILTNGGFRAGKIVTEICMGGLGQARIISQHYDSMTLPAVFVQTDHPAIATLGSQFAGWQIKREDFFAIGSGPARALAMKPRDIYDKIDYKDKAENAVLVLETSKEPSEQLIRDFATECGVSTSRLCIVLVPTASLTGSIQVSGRIVETGVHKLLKLGIDPKSIQSACGYAPIAPVHPKFSDAMGRTNDVILYGGVVFYWLKHQDDDELSKILSKAPASASKQYGKPFKQIFKEADNDFYQIDPNLFAPARFIVNNTITGSVFDSGKADAEILNRSMNMAYND